MAAWRTIMAAALAVFALAGTQVSAQVPDPFARQLAQKLARAEGAFAGSGFVRGAGPFAGDLGAGEAAAIPLTLRAGETYRIVGVCDARCGVPQMNLRNGEGVVLARAALAGEAVMMDVRVAFTGRHEVEVTLPRCRSEPCWYAVNVYSR